LNGNFIPVHLRNQGLKNYLSSSRGGVYEKTIYFHLEQLEDVGLIEGKHVMTKDVKPIVIKNYRVTPKGRQTYNHIMSFKRG